MCPVIGGSHRGQGCTRPAISGTKSAIGRGSSFAVLESPAREMFVMPRRRRQFLILTVAACVALVSPVFADPAPPQARPRPPVAGRGIAGRGTLERQPPRAFQEPAFARGYTDGFRQGRTDGRGGKRYDPAGHTDYRSADQAYSRAYGSRDAYKNNYRAGFRQGYEDGYRDSTR